MASSLPSLESLVQSLRQRIAELAPEHSKTHVVPPMPDAQVDEIRGYYAPRHLPDELVAYLRLPSEGLLTRMKPSAHRFGHLYTRRLDDSADEYVVEEVGAGRTPRSDFPASRNWIPLGEWDSMWLQASTAEPQPLATIFYWDVNAGGDPVQVKLPSLRSLMWVWDEMLKDYNLDAILQDDSPHGPEDIQSVLYQLANTGPPRDQPRPSEFSRRYKGLRDLATEREDPHSGWVPDQPPPDRDGVWTMEWLTACGVCDLDV